MEPLWRRLTESHYGSERPPLSVESLFRLYCSILSLDLPFPSTSPVHILTSLLNHLSTQLLHLPLDHIDPESIVNNIESSTSTLYLLEILEALDQWVKQKRNEQLQQQQRQQQQESQQESQQENRQGWGRKVSFEGNVQVMGENDELESEDDWQPQVDGALSSETEYERQLDQELDLNQESAHESAHELDHELELELDRELEHELNQELELELDQELELNEPNQANQELKASQQDQYQEPTYHFDSPQLSPPQPVVAPRIIKKQISKQRRYTVYPKPSTHMPPTRSLSAKVRHDLLLKEKKELDEREKQQKRNLPKVANSFERTAMTASNGRGAPSSHRFTLVLGETILKQRQERNRAAAVTESVQESASSSQDPLSLFQTFLSSHLPNVSLPPSVATQLRSNLVQQSLRQQRAQQRHLKVLENKQKLASQLHSDKEQAALLKRDYERRLLLDKKRTEQQLQRSQLALLRERRRALARMETYKQDVELALAARQLRKRDKEENLVRQLAKTFTETEKSLYRESVAERSYQTRSRTMTEQRQKVAWEKYYQDQSQLLEEEIHSRREKQSLQEKAYLEHIRKYYRDQKESAKRQIAIIKQQLRTDDEDMTYRELDARRLRDAYLAARLATHRQT